MILKNKLTRETLEITYPEFRKKFAGKNQYYFYDNTEYCFIFIYIKIYLLSRLSFLSKLGGNVL